MEDITKFIDGVLTTDGCMSRHETAAKDRNSELKEDRDRPVNQRMNTGRELQHDNLDLKINLETRLKGAEADFYAEQYGRGALYEEMNLLSASHDLLAMGVPLRKRKRVSERLETFVRRNRNKLKDNE